MGGHPLAFWPELVLRCPVPGCPQLARDLDEWDPQRHFNFRHGDINCWVLCSHYNQKASDKPRPPEWLAAYSPIQGMADAAVKTDPVRRRFVIE